MAQPLDESYFTWLYSQVGSLRNNNPKTTYWNLLKLLYTKEFVWIVPNDDNRLEDGRNLRMEFLDETPLRKPADAHWMRQGCDMLEMLIALSRRLEFQTDTEARTWFWKLIRNLALEGYSDAHPHIPKDYINQVLDDVIWRTYDSDGHGGLFPLKRPTRDQRDVEIWYQLSAYLLENE